MPATSIFNRAESAPISGEENSWNSILLGPVRTAASTCSVMGISVLFGIRTFVRLFKYEALSCQTPFDPFHRRVLGVLHIRVAFLYAEQQDPGSAVLRGQCHTSAEVFRRGGRQIGDHGAGSQPGSGQKHRASPGPHAAPGGNAGAEQP